MARSARPGFGMPKRTFVVATNGFGAFWDRNATVGIEPTPTRSGPFTCTVSGDAGPQLPAASLARTQTLRTPVRNGVVSSVPVRDTVEPEPTIVSGCPVPAMGA